MSGQPQVPPTAEGVPIDPAWPPPLPEDVPDARAQRAERAQLSLKDAGVIIGVFALLAFLCGVAWFVLVDPAQKVRVDGGVGQNEIELARMFGYDGWYAVLAAPVALLAGLVLTSWRSRDPLVTLLLILAACAVAAVVMLATGYVLGPSDPEKVLAHAPIGTTADVQMKVAGFATYLAWPIPALVGSLISLLSRAD